VRPNGTGTHSLGIVATCANWFPNGSKILFTNDAAAGPLRPATINPDGSGLHALDATHDPHLNLGCGGVSPDGTRLVLEGFPNDANHPRVDGIYTVRSSDGGGLVRLTRSPVQGEDAYPRFSPDGRQVVFQRTTASSSPNGAGALFVVNSDGTGLRRITPWGFAFDDENWSPDGRWIAFQRPYGVLYLVHPDGTGLHRIPLTLPAGSGAVNPVWSADGSWLAFSLPRNGEANIWIVHPDGSGLTQVTHAAGVEEQVPDWRGP
jgi:Tol biopolymer transport system component